MASLHALLPRHYLDRATCARARAAAPASQLLFGAIHVSVSHLPTNISLEMYYQIRTKELTLGNASVLGTHPKKIKNVSLIVIPKKGQINNKKIIAVNRF